MSTSVSIQDILGHSPASPIVRECLSYINQQSNASDPPQIDSPEVKAYSDAVYFNYYALGLSLMFAPTKGYKPSTGTRREQLKDDCLELSSVDIYNTPKSTETKSKTAEVAFSTFPASPIVLSLATSTPEDKDRPQSMSVTHETIGQDFVVSLGEPARKGGGSGPSSGSIGIWCEWTKDGIMVEFGGQEARGPQAWERGKDAGWRVITIFAPK
ncbi:hypothetical protein CONPUDRAFT_95784 [Coniophora puteana RWD-64-598 SS2]|uniref:Uncharacterized protein n=1 Tax=Coniophora puteana (strain RWD-64-598) TaxID=741705 RepID=A0A5M3N5Z9_CONPW|nr:uncharacterized protein CONPUDRAFT_95784 [Coniophora puteana RWD-64-598 SS2]EIW86852.1 hypothetical protein CONPUDRAFT_95784 [Coniophora puteana RWD-64-598 SS2]